jgi:hypothetical protein
VSRAEKSILLRLFVKFGELDERNARHGIAAKLTMCMQWLRGSYTDSADVMFIPVSLVVSKS